MKYSKNMLFRNRRHFTLCSVICLVFVCSQVVFAGGDDWREVTPAELAMTKPQVENDADVEAIFWEVRVNDSKKDLIEEHYIRVKVFSESGRERFSKIDIPYSEGVKIKDIRARIIKPDGSIIEIAKADIFEREILKGDDVKIKAMSFAVPNIEPGVILEYQYREITKNSGFSIMSLILQRDIPIQQVTFYVKPYGNNLNVTKFNADGVKFIKDKGGFYVATMKNVPALKDEPYMPPADHVRSWMLIYYSNNSNESNYWGRFSGLRADWYKFFKPDKEVKNILPQIIGEATTSDEKLSRIFQFCKTQIKNVTYDPRLSPEERQKIYDKNNSTKDTVKQRQGGSNSINTLFGALATAAGFEARYVYSGDRSRFFFDPSFALSSFVHLSAIGIKTETGWKFYDPGSHFVPEGMLPWHDEFEDALLIGKDNFIWTTTPLSGVDKTVAKRTAKLKLLEDGTLEGFVKLEYTGHLSTRSKLLNYDESLNQQEERLIKTIKRRMSTAELSNIIIENVQDPEKPFIYQFKIRVPNYAQKTGKRLFFQPGFFETGESPVFSSSTRKYEIYFNYPWSEQDDIEIELPENYELDSAESPEKTSDPNKIGFLNIDVNIDKAGNTLNYKRRFHFGDDNNILFPVSRYKNLKNLFDLFHKADSHTITLKQK